MRYIKHCLCDALDQSLANLYLADDKSIVQERKGGDFNIRYYGNFLL